jgi:hypothetical protein
LFLQDLLDDGLLFPAKAFITPTGLKNFLNIHALTC